MQSPSRSGRKVLVTRKNVIHALRVAASCLLFLSLLTSCEFIKRYLYGGLPLKEIEITPSEPTVEIGATLTFIAVGYYGKDGSIPFDGAAVNWSSSDTSVAAVDAEGIATALAEGSTIITATSVFYSKVSDSTTLTVTDPQSGTPAGISVSPTLGLVTSEAGGEASFSVVLDSEPTADVTIELSSGNSAEGTVAPAGLIFTSTNWSIYRTATVTGQDDAVDDGDKDYVIITSVVSDDSSYNSLAPPDVSVTNTDDDIAGITVSPTSGLVTTELGGTAAISVVLDSQPTGDVSILLSSSDTF